MGFLILMLAVFVGLGVGVLADGIPWEAKASGTL
jgi:hypothetical protein